MFCENYRCRMSEATCVVRRRNALDNKKNHAQRPGFADPRCKDCEQGTKIAKLHDPAAVKKYSDGLRQAQINAVAYRKRTGKLLADVAELEVLAQKRIAARQALNPEPTPKPKPVKKSPRKPPKTIYKKNPLSYEHIINLLKDEIKYHFERIECCQKAIIALEEKTPAGAGDLE